MDYYKNRSAHYRNTEEIGKVRSRLSLADKLAHSVLALALDETQGDEPLAVKAVLEVVDRAHGHHVRLESRRGLVVLSDTFVL